MAKYPENNSLTWILTPIEFTKSSIYERLLGHGYHFIFLMDGDHAVLQEGVVDVEDHLDSHIAEDKGDDRPDGGESQDDIKEGDAEVSKLSLASLDNIPPFNKKHLYTRLYSPSVKPRMDTSTKTAGKDQSLGDFSERMRVKSMTSHIRAEIDAGVAGSFSETESALCSVARNIKDLAHVIKDVEKSTQGRADDIERAVDSANTHLLQVEQDVVDVKVRLTTVESDVAQMKSDIVDVKGRLTTVESDIAKMKSDIVDVKGRLTTVESDIAEMKSDIAEMKSDIAEMKSDIAEMKAGIQTLVGKVHESTAHTDSGIDLVTEVKNLRVDVDKLRTINNRHDDLITCLKQWISNPQLAE